MQTSFIHPVISLDDMTSMCVKGSSGSLVLKPEPTLCYVYSYVVCIDYYTCTMLFSE